MAFNRMKKENLARFLVLLLAAGFAAAALVMRAKDSTIEVHAAMPEDGGWKPDVLTVSVDEPLTLRLVSDDVVHGFAIGQSDQQPVDILPGKPVEITLTFDRPGVYTYYCTRWCGPNHWRMRGTITVEGDEVQSTDDPATSPLYLTLGIDLDAPHDVTVDFIRQPSAERGQALGVDLPEDMQRLGYIREHSPYQAWQRLRGLSETSSLEDADIWDMVALLWAKNTTSEAIQVGERLYAQNCAACHGETGGGDGVFAVHSDGLSSIDSHTSEFGEQFVPTTDFTDGAHMLGASPALLQGKIIRGGMGTGMPSWGAILTEDETWKLIDYVWTFLFDYKE